MAVGPLTITYARDEVVDFSSSFYFEQVGILIKITSKAPPSPWDFAFLFDDLSWGAIFVFCIIATVCIYLVNILTPVESARNTETIDSSAWFIYSVMVNQCKGRHNCMFQNLSLSNFFLATDTSLHAWSIRMFVTFWRVCAFVLISTYISGLVADLSTEQLSLPFTDLQQLAIAVSKGKYKVCIDSNNAFHAAVLVFITFVQNSNINTIFVFI